jgi:peptide/nickel transport system ATP-binding protein
VKIISKIPILNRYKRTLQREVEKDIVKLLHDMRLPDPERVMEMYPHQLSGGMAQRIVIAMALACNPKLLIADEPTTNLDVTVQAQILHLIRDLKNQYGSTIQYITHDMGVIAEMCDRVAVMYAGSVVEVAESLELFRNPLHPYTKALLESIPRPGKEFKSIEGNVPGLINPPKGCRFHERCLYAMDVCRKTKPKFLEAKKEHFVECHLY